jgi:uncharacterized membrane protein required for colicin V production
MTGELEYSLPLAIRRISGAFRLFGWISFWAQLAFGIIAAVTLLAAVAMLSGNSAQNNPGAGAGIFLTVVGLVTVFASVFLAYRYTRLGRLLRSQDDTKRPKPKTAIRTLKTGLMINLGGMLLTLLGVSSIVGVLFLKAISQPQGVAFGATVNVNQFVRAVDILVIQATTVVLLAHFVGLVVTLWIMNSLDNT